jgi:hypothetical protein
MTGDWGLRVSKKEQQLGDAQFSTKKQVSWVVSCLTPNLLWHEWFDFIQVWASTGDA